MGSSKRQHHQTWRALELASAGCRNLSNIIATRMMRATLRQFAQAVLLGAAFSSSAPASAVPILDSDRISHARFGNDAPWYVSRIPFFESADSAIDTVYYYRWAMFRAHQRDLGAEGFISTEFLDDVGWQRDPYASLNDATGFHIAEGRWLRDRRYTDDYIRFMYQGGNDRHFTDYMADSVYGRYLVDGDRSAATRHLGAMRHIYRLWDDRYDFAKGLYWVEPLLDATEYTISSIDASGGKDGFRGGDSFRPSINAYMFANARAIAELAKLSGDSDAAAEYNSRAAAIRARVQESLWSPGLGHFIDRFKTDNQFVKYWQPIRGRELVGYLPWTFNLVDDEERYAGAWRHALDAKGFGGDKGLRTVEPTYEYYMRQYRYEGSAPECQWNGPTWPFQTTQVLIGMANLLDHYHQSVVTRSDYMRLLRQYASLHFHGGRLDLEEDYHPDTGDPIVGLPRSHHYFHSGFNDLVLTGLVGIRPRADDVLEVNPLLPEAGDKQALPWFHVQNVRYHGHDVSVTWDADGRRYGQAGLTITVDGKRVAHRATIGRVTVALTRREEPAPVHPIARSVQLVRGEFPRGSASSNADAEKIHDAIDGRVWFFPELPNGWDSTISRAPQWFSVDFGRPTSLSRAELAFFADGEQFAAPASYRLQMRTATGWRDLRTTNPPVLANGVTTVIWNAISTDKIRLIVRQEAQRRTRLVEIKLF
ncbi:MGH1-like glycoside hydrolase domain-containing protein [Sphingomonas endolithica]|uniref:MGH1-like glycoside hydrolase domain-containing protein n=1 Tax=Sphingomonas endolithica TaxID=2972485 RepID=UPI0021AF2166|nr:glycosyl hydrolase family 65 protein [Sphingomonas sp. ZFBP2030]